MDRLSMSELTTFRWSFEDDVHRYRAAGYSALAVWRHKLSDFGEEKGIELLHESGLRVSSLQWAGGFTGSDGRSYKDAVEDALDAVRLAHALRAGCLVIYPGARGGHTHNHARRLVRSALAEVGPAAAELGVTLGLEPMHPGCAGEWTFLTSLDDALGMLDSAEPATLQLVFDSYHLGHDPANVERLSELAPQVALVHLGDAREPPRGEQSRVRLGAGTLPLAEIVQRLCGAGYTGFFEVELLGEEIESADLEELLVQSRQAFRGLTATAPAVR